MKRRVIDRLVISTTRQALKIGFRIRVTVYCPDERLLMATRRWLSDPSTLSSILQRVLKMLTFATQSL
ncbi:hypothetical protein GCK32_012937 [Trichostrongylus colubriformis]|uniref:Uncharacterized protein n=1 Tax=Trichostrongylus colubriformis TaxID=6319 RepID=A0AAN8G476_TRICO